MFDARQILADLQRQAEAAARDFKVADRIEDAKAAAQKAKERLDADPKARTAAAAGGGLLLLGLLGTKGGRRLVGDIAQTGAVAALGALAYKAWADRQGRPAGDAKPEAIAALGYPTSPERDPEFAEAVVLAMVAAAHADGVIDEQEQKLIDAALARAGNEDRKFFTGEAPQDEIFARLAAAAKSPNHAAELYAAATVMIGAPNPKEAGFLARLATTLGVDEANAAAIAAAANR